MFDTLAGKVALITGASRGVGRAAAHKFAALGAHVAAAARNEAQVVALAEALNSDRGAAARAGHIGVRCDVARYEDCAAAVAATVDAFGRLDILVNNAGVIDPIIRLEEADPEAWGAAIDVNVKGVFHGLRAATAALRAAGGGVVVNLSSGAAEGALEGWSHYCASKAAVKRLTACAHRELADHGVRVVGLSPGTVATDMMATIKASGVNPVSQLDWSTHIPPEWAAEAIVFLCGPGGAAYAGTDFALKTDAGRAAVGLPPAGTPPPGPNETASG